MLAADASRRREAAVCDPWSVGCRKVAAPQGRHYPAPAAEAPAWLPLRAFRPGADPLLNFAEAWARSFADFGKREAHGVIRDRLFEAWSKAERATGVLTRAGHATVEAALEAEGRRLRDRPDAAPRRFSSASIKPRRRHGQTATAGRRSPITFVPPW